MTISRVDGPLSALDVGPRHFLALIEGLVREDPTRAANLDALYAEARPALAPDPAVSRAERRREIDRVTRLFGG